MNILINKTDSLGELLLTIPMVKLLKEKKKDCRVGIMVDPIYVELLQNIKEFDYICSYDKSVNYFKKWIMVNKIYKEFKPDHYLYIGGSQFPNFAFFIKRVAFRGGLRSKFWSFIFLNKGIRQSRNIVAMHELEYNFGLVGELGIDFISYKRSRYIVDFKYSSEQKIKAFNDFGMQCFNIDPLNKNNVIFIHPAVRGKDLSWPIKNYAFLIKEIFSKYRDTKKIVISFGNIDKGVIDDLKKYLIKYDDGELVNSLYYYNCDLAGILNYSIILSHVYIFIGGNTGFTHLANLVNISQISIYGPIKIESIKRFGPLMVDENCVIFVPDVVCGEQFHCAGKTCPYYECMPKVEVNTVLDQIDKFVDEYIYLGKKNNEKN